MGNSKAYLEIFIEKTNFIFSVGPDEMFQSGAQEAIEPALHVTQQTNGAEPQGEICPKCGDELKSTALFYVCRYCGYCTTR